MTNIVLKAEDIQLSTKALIFDSQNRVLLLHDSGGYWWDLPGGHLEDGETILEGLIREVREESGLQVTSAKQLFVKNLELGKPPKDRPVVFFIATVRGNINLSNEHQDYAWVGLEDLDKYKQLGVFLPIIKEIYSELDNDGSENLQKIGNHMMVTDLGQPYYHQKTLGQFTGEPMSEINNSGQTQSEWELIDKILEHRNHRINKSGYSEAGGRAEREKPFIESDHDASVSSESGTILPTSSAAVIDKPGFTEQAIGGSGFAGEGPININFHGRDDTHDDLYGGGKLRRDYDSALRELHKQIATDIMGNSGGVESVRPDKINNDKKETSFTNHPELPVEQRPLGEGETNLWLDGDKQGKIYGEDAKKIVGNFDEPREQFTNLSADIIKSNDLRVLTQNAIKKAELGKTLVVAGWGNYYVVDREGHRISLDALRRGLQKFLHNPSYANVNIFHSGIQVGELLAEFKDENGQLWQSHVNDEGFFAVVAFRSDIEVARRAMSEVLKGNLRGFSLAGNSNQETRQQVCEHGICFYEINDVEFYELTLCQVPMNQNSWITDIIQMPDKTICPECYEDERKTYDSSLRLK